MGAVSDYPHPLDRIERATLIFSNKHNIHTSSTNAGASPKLWKVGMGNKNTTPGGFNPLNKRLAKSVDKKVRLDGSFSRHHRFSLFQAQKDQATKWHESASGTGTTSEAGFGPLGHRMLLCSQWRHEFLGFQNELKTNNDHHIRFPNTLQLLLWTALYRLNDIRTRRSS